ncbi:MAG: hypothetical protein O3B86_01065 [Planctomycetota bacterium]|nr:hypothetical protein [Planctomycetota bacterium]
MAAGKAELWIARCWKRLRFGQFLTSAADWLAVYLFVLGSAVLLTKLAVPQFWPNVLWLVAGAVPVAVAAWWVSGRELFSRTESVALLDNRLEAGGLLMTLCEAPDALWEERLPQLESLWRSSLPQYRPVRFARQMAGPFAFVLAACLVPLREIEAAPALRNTAGEQATSQLQELLTELEKSDVLDEEEKKELEDEIAKLVEETRETPLTHEKWETVDALQERMRMRVETTAAELATAQQALAALKNAADGDFSSLSIESLEMLSKDVLEMLQKMADKGAFDKLPKDLSDQLQRLMKDSNGQFQLPKDPAELSELLDELDGFLQGESQKLSELRSKCKGGKCQGCADCEAGCACTGPTDVACTCPNCPKGGCAGGQCSAGNMPGSGGVSRGRGDADLTWGDESSLENTKFKESVLPPGMLDKPRDEVVGITIAAPETDVADSAPRSAARTATTASGDETWKGTVRPRHRSVVKRYFEKQVENK